MSKQQTQQVEATAIQPQAPAQQYGNMIDVASSRAAQEVQAAMVIAKRFPRDTIAAEKRILDACKRVRLAENALYSYPRGGAKVEGESIRLAEVYLQCWGNVEAGVVELSRGNGESTAMAYCMDLETNARDVKIFTVKHIRDRSERKGGNVLLTDERDIYELVANMGARRKRACILSVVPIDIREAAVEQCRATLEGDTTVPLIDRVKAMVKAFEPFGVSPDMIVQRLGHKLDVTTAHELVTLRGIFASIRDGMSSTVDWFEAPGGNGDKPPAGGNAAVLEKLKGKGQPQPAQPEPEQPQGGAEDPPQTVAEQGEAVWGDGAPGAAETPQPADGEEITPETPCECEKGHKFAYGQAVESPDGIGLVCPECGTMQFTIGAGEGGPKPETDAEPIVPVTKQWVCMRSSKHVFDEPPAGGVCPKCKGKIKELDIRF